MNKLSTERRAAVIRALAEGNSIRATVRLTGAAKDTVTKLLVRLGTACFEYHDTNVRALKTRRVQCDEIWAFVGAKQKNVLPEHRGKGFGDVWTWTALDADSKFMITWHVGQRDEHAARWFIDDLSYRLANRVQITTDGLSLYRPAIETAFGWNGVDYAMIVKHYATTDESGKYSPAKCTGCEKTWVMGDPDPEHVSTSYTERANLTIRMQNRRFTRLTNAFSKKVANHAHSVALHMMYYNYCRRHQTLTQDAGGIHTTPAMAAGLTDHVWKVEELVALI